jgi:hypothetical protein
MDGPRLEDFEGALGETWEVAAGDGIVPLRLTVAQALPRALRDEGGFRLEWAGPVDPLLPQATYSLRRDGRSVDMFIVPVAKTADGYRYEAIYN